jgi:adenylyltransferase/sulfurtransferase
MELISAVEINNNRELYYIVDIREPYEYEFSNINTINIPMNEVCLHLKELPKNKKIVLMCHTDNRSSALANLLSVEFEMSNIYVMKGGIKSWKELVDYTLILE